MRRCIILLFAIFLVSCQTPPSPGATPIDFYPNITGNQYILSQQKSMNATYMNIVEMQNHASTKKVKSQIKGYFILNFDADVIVPNVTECPVYKVGFHQYNKNNVLSSFLGESTKGLSIIYERDLVNGAPNKACYKSDVYTIAFNNPFGYLSLFSKDYDIYHAATNKVIEIPTGVCAEIRFTKKQTIDIAQSIVQKLKLPYDTNIFDITANQIENTNIQYYKISFSQMVDNIQICKDSYILKDVQDRSITSSYCYVEVGDNGFIYLQSQSMDVTSELNNDVNIIDINDALNLLAININTIFPLNISKENQDITNIELNYVVRPIQGDLKNYKLIPAWVLYNQNHLAVIRIDATDGTIIQ